MRGFDRTDRLRSAPTTRPSPNPRSRQEHSAPRAGSIAPTRRRRARPDSTTDRATLTGLRARSSQIHVAVGDSAPTPTHPRRLMNLDGNGFGGRYKPGHAVLRTGPSATCQSIWKASSIPNARIGKSNTATVGGPQQLQSSQSGESCSLSACHACACSAPSSSSAARWDDVAARERLC